MKRFLKTLLVLLLIVTPVTFASAKKTTTTAKQEGPGTVTMYVFYGDGCPHCADLEEYIKNTLKKDSRVQGKFNVVYYEVWNTKADGKTADDHPQNKTLLSDVSTTLTGKAATGVPFYVIGEKYFSGYGESFNDEIVNTILAQAENPNYKDVVAEAIEGMTTKPETSNPEVDDASNDNEKANKTDVVGLVILGITVVVVLAIIFTRHTDDEEEVVEPAKEETKKEVKVEVKAEPKKETEKATTTTKKAVKKNTAKKTVSKTATTKKKSTKKNNSKKVVK